MSRCLVLAVWVAWVLAACGGVAGPTQSATGEKGQQAEAALSLLSDAAETPRLHELVVRSPAMGGEQKLLVLLPTDYDPTARDPYPVLYLLNGCCGDHRGFYENTDLAAFTAKLRLIVVMPDGGPFGFYSDWIAGGPRWETYHVRELLPWVERTYHVRTDRNGRMLAGLSMGGHGAFAYAARYPDLFGSAAAYSPLVDLNAPAESGWVYFDALRPEGMPSGAEIWGDHTEEEVRWRGHNPWDLAENLGNTTLFLRTGDGTYGDGVPHDQVEWYVHQQAESMHRELGRLGIAHSYEVTQGGHEFSEWQAGLHLTLPQQLALATAVPAPPRSFSYRSIQPVFSVYGWDVVLKRNVIEFARLGDVTEYGFTISGSGDAFVRTAPWYRPGAQYRVGIAGAERCFNADETGRLWIHVTLGPSRTVQEYRAGSPSGYLATQTVAITDTGVGG